MKKVFISFLVAAFVLLPTLARAQSEEEIRKKVIEDLKPWIEQEVQRRVKEAMEAMKAAAKPATPTPTEEAVTPEKAKLAEQLAKELAGPSAFPPMSNKPIPLFSSGGTYRSSGAGGTEPARL